MRSKPELQFNASQANILIVDDHPQMRKAISRILAQFEFGGVHEAAAGGEAIKILRELPIDLVICDIYLLDISGFDVLEFVRNRDVNNDIPVLLVTGEASKDDIVKAADRGANDYLLKPFRAEDLQLKIQTLLNSYHNPPELTKLIRQAERFFIQKDFKSSMSLVDQVLSKEKSHTGAKFLKALILDRTDHAPMSLSLHQQIVELNPNYYRSFAAMAEIYLRSKQNGEAIEAIGRELELNPKQPRRQTQLATLLLEAGKVDLAIGHFREALKENVKYLYALFGMGKSYATAGNIDKAIYYYKRVRRYYPTNTKCLEAIVKACLDAGEIKKAEFALKDEKNANKNRVDTYLVLAKLYLASDEKEKSFGIINELLTLKPDSTQGLKLKAAIHMKYKEINPAIEIYEHLIKEAPDAETHLQLADILITVGSFPKAIKHLYEAIKAVENPNQLLSRFVTSYFKSNEYAKALLVLKKIEKESSLSESLKAILNECQKQTQGRRLIHRKNLAS